MAVMATTEAPLEQMSFNEKAHPAPQSDLLPMDTEMNGWVASPLTSLTSRAKGTLTDSHSTNSYDGLFDEPANQNGAHPDPMDTQESLPSALDTVVSTTLAAEDESAAPVTHVSSGVTPVTDFLPDPVEETVADTTIAPPVEQPLSDLRSEPPVIEAPVLAVGATLTESAPTSSGNEDPIVEESLAVEGASNEQPTLEAGVTDITIEESAPVVAEVPMVADSMDTTEDATEPTIAEVSEASAQEPMSSVEEPSASTAPILDASAPISDAPATESPAEQTSIFGSPEHTSGQVRHREDDDEEAEPAAKRAKTESMEEPAAITAPEVESSESQAPIVVAQATPSDTLAPVVATENGATSVSPAFANLKTSWDSNPITPIQHKYLLEQVRKAKKVKFSLSFLKPVDWQTLAIPNYPLVITHPMDLDTLEQKHRRNEYANTDTFMADFNLIISNCKTFNGPDHPISQQADNLKAYFYKNISLMPKGAAAKPSLPPPKVPKKITTPAASKKASPRPNRQPTAKSPVEPKSNVGFVKSDGMPIIRRDSSANHDRPKRDIIPPKSRDWPPQPRPKKKTNQLELKFCEAVTNEMFRKKHASFAYPFLQPVDPVALNIPNYLKIVKKPMDFGTIHANLKNSVYANAKEYLVDAQLVFQNCFKFNPATDEVHKMGKLTEELFNKTWEGKDQYLADNAPASEPASDAEDEDESDEEDEEDHKKRQLLEIQQQITALTAQAMQITTGDITKRPSPKASSGKKSKGAKPAPSKAVKRSNSMVVPAAKAARPKPKPKWKKLTLEQKREVSEGIANLDEANMRKAVQIIRNGVPALKVSRRILPLRERSNNLYRKSRTMNWNSTLTKFLTPLSLSYMTL